jgi:8-oxo-dGTP pyrophosphatase MutT (NUDIX family)
MIDKITKIFADRKGKIIGNYKKNSVMILLKEYKGELNIIFEVRALNLRHQPGDICLPGGKIEEDELPLEAAIRETKEELNLKDEDIEILGEMDYFVSPYGSIIYPFVAKVKKVEIEPNPGEVDHIFMVPLRYLIDNEPIHYDMNIGPSIKEDFPFHLIRGGRDYKFSNGRLEQYFYKYNEYVIWGFTARIVKAFIDILKENK